MHSRPGIQLEVIETHPAQVFDESGAEMQLVTLALAVSRWSQGVFFRNNWAQIQAEVGGRWENVADTFSLSSLGPGEVKREQLLFPARAESCRIRLQWAGASLPWRLGGVVSRLGIKLPPSYWSWAGWPKPPEGRNPRWKTIVLVRALTLNRQPSHVSLHNPPVHRAGAGPSTFRAVRKSNISMLFGVPSRAPVGDWHRWAVA